MKRRLWMVGYDVANNKCRHRLELALLALGERIQYSVFECFLTVEEARSHLGRLARMLNAKTDSLRAYPMCAWCAPTVDWLGMGSRSTDQRTWIL